MSNAAAFLTELQCRADPVRAEQMARYHKVRRHYLGVANPELDLRVREWRRRTSVNERVAMASELWVSDIHEARIAAAKLLTQAILRPDNGAWRLINSWVPDFDAWAVADHACMAGAHRLVAHPDRLDIVETWTGSSHMWSRRAALVITLPWARKKEPDPEDIARRERILDWAAGYVDDPEWFIQKAIAWWVRDLSRRNPSRSRAFVDVYGKRMKPFARKEASRHLAS